MSLPLLGGLRLKGGLGTHQRWVDIQLKWSSLCMGISAREPAAAPPIAPDWPRLPEWNTPAKKFLHVAGVDGCQWLINIEQPRATFPNFGSITTTCFFLRKFWLFSLSCVKILVPWIISAVNLWCFFFFFNLILIQLLHFLLQLLLNCTTERLWELLGNVVQQKSCVPFYKTIFLKHWGIQSFFRAFF